MAGRISIVIPVLNEASILDSSLKALAGKAPDAEIIVVDGGSNDRSAEVAARHGVTVLHFKPGRARQMNWGARQASGDILLFLHADTILPDHFQEHVWGILHQEGVAAGAFRLRIDGGSVSLRLIEMVANWRAKLLQMPYGDQALFIRARLFHEAGCFAQIPILEDLEIIRRLRHHGKIVIAPVFALTSARRWKELGVIRTTLLNQLALVAYCAGIRPATIARWYWHFCRRRPLLRACRSSRAAASRPPG